LTDRRFREAEFDGARRRTRSGWIDIAGGSEGTRAKKQA